jgi:hypothetical protein
MQAHPKNATSQEVSVMASPEFPRISVVFSWSDKDYLAIEGVIQVPTPKPDTFDGPGVDVL